MLLDFEEAGLGQHNPTKGSNREHKLNEFLTDRLPYQYAPGQLMTATALLNALPRPDAAQVKQAMVGNLCRCSNYNAIVEAVVAAGAQQGGAA
jgi:aerobic-type carbon monoxide dehydrogenase small subunit (CoxS/CutS family)